MAKTHLEIQNFKEINFSCHGLKFGAAFPAFAPHFAEGFKGKCVGWCSNVKCCRQRVILSAVCEGGRGGKMQEVRGNFLVILGVCLNKWNSGLIQALHFQTWQQNCVIWKELWKNPHFESWYPLSDVFIPSWNAPKIRTHHIFHTYWVFFAVLQVWSGLNLTYFVALLAGCVGNVNIGVSVNAAILFSSFSRAKNRNEDSEMGHFPVCLSGEDCGRGQIFLWELPPLHGSRAQPLVW